MRKKILVLDDDADLLEILTIILTDAGYELLPLVKGDKIFASIMSFDPDLISMDIMLAGRDGSAICKLIKLQTYTHALPVILVSGTHNISQVMNLAGSPDNFLAKPLDLDHVLKMVSQQLD